MSLSGKRLTEIVIELVSRPGHEKIRALMYELLVYGLGASSTDIHFERHMPEVRGRLDALLGQTVFEFKRDLRRERRDAEEELGRYLPQRERETGERFIGLATDGAEFVPFEIEDGRLVALPGYRPSVDDPRGLLVWLDSAVSLRPNLAPEPDTVRIELGRDSLAYRRAVAGLRDLWHEVKDRPEVELKRKLWADFLAVVYGSRIDADELFLQHTYLTIVAKTMATRVLAVPLPPPADLLSGRPFRDAGISGAVESDFFDWVLHAAGGADLVARISKQVVRFRLHDVEHDVLKGLYESLIDPEQRHDLGEYYTPDWLAQRICASAVELPLRQRVLDPACGSGTFLFHAVRQFFAAAEKLKVPPAEALRNCLEKVIGIDVHPVAILVARVTYLLALGPERLRDRPEALSLPVYLGDSLQWNTRQLFAQLDVVISVPDGPELYFPERLANNPARFDDTVHMMMQLSEQNAGNDAFREWLRRERVCDRRDFDVLVETYAHMRELRQSGRNHIWGYIARNLSRPLWLSSAYQRADVIVGNPPWLTYRYLSRPMQKKFRLECQARNLWAGGKLATHQDLSGYFFARCAELYLKNEGTIALVMPYGALNRAQFAGFRSGRFNNAEVRFFRVWAFDENVQPLFPIPSSVFFAKRSAAGPLPTEITAFRGHLPFRDSSPEEATLSLRFRKDPWPLGATLAGGSPYRRAFRQGATMVPRRLCVVERVVTGRLGVNPTAPLVESRGGKQDKRPWRDLAPLHGTVEAQFLHPLFLGESVAPFRLLRPALAVVPWDRAGGDILDAEAARERGYPGLSAWLRDAEHHWRALSGGTMSLVERWNYHQALRRQVTRSPIRVVYAKSGKHLAAAVVEQPDAFIDHKLYWATVETHAEALYLTALLNSEAIRTQIAALQSRGRWGARDFDKLVFELPIPRFEAGDPLHRTLVQTARAAAQTAATVDLKDTGHFVQARQRIRVALAASGLAQRIDELVGRLLS
ncbi:MAG: N-6 DNA methylase [Rhodospirillales bacterium]